MLLDFIKEKVVKIVRVVKKESDEKIMDTKGGSLNWEKLL